MIGHHISEHARQKILKEIAVRAQKHVLDPLEGLYCNNWLQGAHTVSKT